jgi:regulator of CtrA degradation
MASEKTPDNERGRRGVMGSVSQASTEEFDRAVRDFSASELFRRTFEDGMAMVEETAAYLDGPGREASKALPRRVALAYAGESMRLTTRLMQVASWLLVQRAILDGEMTPAQASQEKYRLGAREVCLAPAMEGTELLPARLQELLDRSAHLYDRVDRLDQMMYRQKKMPKGVNEQLDRLVSAFSARLETERR